MLIKVWLLLNQKIMTKKLINNKQRKRNKIFISKELLFNFPRN